jgi:glycosyltransferase involved in cell wall biosynthesis
MNSFPGRIALQQRVLPAYRAPFFDLLAQRCESGLSVFSGKPLPIEGIIVSDDLGSANYYPGKNLNFLDPSASLFVCWQRGLTHWLKKCDPDVLVVEANPRILSTRILIRWMQKHKRPVLGWGLGLPRSGTLLERLSRNTFLKSLDGVIAYSERGADEYRSFGLERVYLAYNAVLPKPPIQQPYRSSRIGQKSTVIFIGRLQGRKRVDILLRACATLPVKIQPELIIVGDGPVLASLKKLAEEIYPQTQFLGSLHREALKPYFEKADLFALPGTGGLAVQEAMTYGLPIIVAEGDGTQDDLVRPENGWQVKSGDQDSFTTTLEFALSDLGRLQRMGMESYRIVSEEINLETMVDSFLDAFHSIL